ncbi:DUF1643 domain-containing protein [Phreatobacter sp. HK31-P]
MTLIPLDRPAAVFSTCRSWRYVLRRQWRDGPCVGFVLLNPSTADEDNDDPTIRRCIAYAKAWGFGRLVLGNIFAFRATDPAVMRAAPDPIGPENDAHLRNIVQESSGEIVCGWGVHGEFQGRGAAVLDLIRAKSGREPQALSWTKGGHPGHPLYLRADLRPMPWRAAK